MMSKAKRASYTLEFKLEAVRLAKAGQSVAAVGATLGVPAQSISNWLKAEQEGKLGGAGAKPVLARFGIMRGARSQPQRLSSVAATHRARPAASKPHEQRRAAGAHQGRFTRK